MNIREKVLSQLKGTEYISFDIYDTLLFRMVRFPSQIFEKTYERAPELFPDYIVSYEWGQIRIYAEKCAKEKKNGGEVSLADIYAMLPEIIREPDKILRAELETERENTFPNPEMAQLLYELKKKYGKRIILTSDMYLSKDELQGILEYCGVNMSWIEEIFVSSAWGASKKNGKLYKQVEERLCCRPEQILHIGDNWGSDYVNAKAAGWKSVYYPLISEAECRYPYLGYERECYGDIGREIYAMRILAAECHDRTGDEKDWFEMGAMAMGPLFTYAAEWVLDVAEKNHIQNIYPMMRDGYFLMILLQNAAKERGWKGIIEPMYISREALYPPLCSVLKESDVRCILNTKYMTVGKVIDLFGLITEEWSFLEKYREQSLESCKDIRAGTSSVEQEIKGHLLDDGSIHRLRAQNAEADEKLWQYLVSLGIDKKNYITFDVGWKGTTQNAIERLAKKRGAAGKGLHLLVTGREGVLINRNLDDGTDIRGYAGNFGGDARISSSMRVEVFEVFLLCREGTTVKYRYEGEKVVPVSKDLEYEEGELKKSEMAQKGIMSFQKLYFQMRKYSKRIERQNPGDMLRIAARLAMMPTRREAKLIGSMVCEQNIGINKKWQLIEPNSVEKYGKYGFNEFTRKYARPLEWYEGMDAVLDGLIYYKRGMFRLREEVQYRYAMYVERTCRRFEHFVLVGAGQHARTFFMMLNMMDETERVEFIVDNNASLQGDFLYGKEICSFSQISASGCYVITALKRETAAELSVQIKKLDENYVVYDIYS